jgi:hypothetical protein
MFQDLSAATAAEHRRSLRVEGSRGRLARLAACCRESIGSRLLRPVSCRLGACA